MQTIHLSPDDDIISVCDLLDWSDDKRVVFVLPEEETAVTLSIKSRPTTLLLR